MIKVINKNQCCGCAACVQTCPRQCIQMVEDKEGFSYPVVDNSKCVDCKLCEKVCPYLNETEERMPLDVEVAYNQDDQTRMASSSGGIFSILAEYVIKSGGVVFGARFDSHWNVIHDCGETEDVISVFRGSKYIQSKIGDSYRKAKQILESGRCVLFSGTPCHIFALKNYLRKEYRNLFTIDIVCHGVSSPLVWKDYLKYINPNNERIVAINMRDKTRGWFKYSYKIASESKCLFDDYAENSEYLRMYINGFIIRPSCFNCPVKGGRSHSDITLADAWGIKEVYPEMYDEKGLSVICINTDAGRVLYNAISKESKAFPVETFFKENPSYHTSANQSRFRELFWDLYESQGIAAYYSVKKKMAPPFLKRMVCRILGVFNQNK